MRINITSLIRSVIDSVLQKSSPGRDALKLGDQLVGRVIAIKDDGKALVDFGRFRASASVHFHVSEGDEINVRVLEKGPPLRLGLNHSRPGISLGDKKTLSLIEFPSTHTLTKLQWATKEALVQKRGILWSRLVPQEIKNTFIRVAAHFEPLLTGKGITELSSQLKAYVENSGIFFEKKLEKTLIKIFETHENISARRLSRLPEIKAVISQDIKPGISMLKDFFDRRGLILRAFGLKNLESFRNTVDQLMSEVVSQQENQVPGHSRSYAEQVLTYVLPQEENNQKAKLKIYYPKKNKDRSKEGLRLSLLLAMDKIGDVRTDFFLVQKTLNITFFVSNPEIKEYVDRNSSGIVDSLKDSFKNLELNVMVSQKDIEKFETEDVTEEFSGLVDLKV